MGHHSEEDQFYSTGRGGAGNIGRGNKQQEPTFAAEGSNTPQLTTTVYTTGRGGAGNMRVNDDPELARKLQDLNDAAPINPHAAQHADPNHSSAVPAENPTFANHAVGRGGYGNVIATQHAAAAEKQTFVDRVKGIFKHDDKEAESK